MKSLVDQIQESLVNEAREPKVNTTAYDYNGDPVKIIAIYSPIEHDYDEFIRKYDKSGAMEDEAEDWFDDVESSKVKLVAVKGRNGEACFIWGPEGISYEK